MMVILFLFSCSNDKSKKGGNTIEDYLSMKLDSLNIQYSIDATIDNIMIGNEGDPIQVTFFRGDTTIYIIESDYMITDKDDNVHFLGGVKAQIFSDEGCNQCNAIDLSSDQAILSSNSSQIFASGNAVIEYNDDFDHKLLADTIIIYNYDYSARKKYSDNFYYDLMGEKRDLMKELINKIEDVTFSFELCPDYKNSLKLIEGHGNPVIYTSKDTCKGATFFLSDFEHCYWDMSGSNCKGNY